MEVAILNSMVGDVEVDVLYYRPTVHCKNICHMLHRIRIK